MDLKSILIWIVFGLVVGVIARFLMPGRQAMGILMTIVLGIAGSLFGGWLGSLLHGAPADFRSGAGWIGSIIGACLLLFIYGWLQKRHV
jgi:uncharacterized membrane protein YeaQ/YmgE (transglycosylase-associated protein family)